MLVFSLGPRQSRCLIQYWKCSLPFHVSPEIKRRSRLTLSVYLFCVDSALCSASMDFRTIDVVTHFVRKGVQDLECLVMFSARTKKVVHEVRPKPRCPLSVADNVTHSKDKVRKKTKTCHNWTDNCSLIIWVTEKKMRRTHLYTHFTYSESELLWA